MKKETKEVKVEETVVKNVEVFKSKGKVTSMEATCKITNSQEKNYKNSLHLGVGFTETISFDPTDEIDEQLEADNLIVSVVNKVITISNDLNNVPREQPQVVDEKPNVINNEVNVESIESKQVPLYVGDGETNIAPGAESGD